MSRRPGTDLNDVKTSGRESKPKPADIVDIYSFPKKKWITIRLHGPLFAYGGYWITTKKNDGSKGSFYTEAPSFDPKTKERDSTIADPWRDAAEHLRGLAAAAKAKGKNTDQFNLIRYGVAYYGNAIIRKEQAELSGRKLPKPTAEERKSGFKDKDSDSVTPNKAVRLTTSLASKIKELAGLNTRTSKSSGETKAYAVSDPVRGCDIRVYYDPDKAPAEQYQVQIGKPNKLTDEELAYLKWDCSNLGEPDSEEETERSFKRWADKMGVELPSKSKKKGRAEEEGDDDDDDGDDDDTPKSKKKTSSKKPAAKKKPSKDDDFDDDDDDDEGDDFDDDDDDDDDAPKSKKKPAAKGKKKPADDEDEDDDDDDGDDDDSDDFDDDDDDGDEDDDDAPKSKKKAPAKKPVKGKKKPADDDDDFDDDDDDGDDDDDDDGDDDDSDDDDDDDDAPKSKKKAPAKKAPAKGKKKPADDDDFDDDDDSDDDDDGDDDDFDDDDDDDDDDEPKSKKKAPAKKPVKKTRR